MSTIREKNQERIRKIRKRNRARVLRCLALLLCLLGLAGASILLQERQAAATRQETGTVAEPAEPAETAMTDTQETGWVFNEGDGSWMYVLEDGSYAKGWLEDGGKWYYFDEDCVMRTGWQEIDGKWYYFNPGGSMVTGWKSIGGKWYYFNPGGSMVSGWKKIDAKWYYFNPGGSMVTGWSVIGGKWYYFNPGGSMVTGWREIDGEWYYFAESGAMQSGWLSYNGYWYYLRESGKMCTGWEKIDGEWYHLAENGRMESGWITENGTTYYLRESGKMHTGWLTVGSDQYYFAENGAMQTGYVYDDGEWFLMNSNGKRNMSKKILYLTFDDGPGKYTEKLLGTLKKYGVRATFFVTGQYSKYLPLIEDEAKDGHAVAVHTYSHEFKDVYASTTAYWKDFEKIESVIVKYTGKRSNLVRFPGGSSNRVSARYCSGIMSTLTKQMGQKGYYYFDWNVDSNDAGGTTTASGILSNLKSRVKKEGASVILCHDVKSYTVEAMDSFIPWALKEGYIFLPLSEKAPGAHHRVNN